MRFVGLALQRLQASILRPRLLGRNIALAFLATSSPTSFAAYSFPYSISSTGTSMTDSDVNDAWMEYPSTCWEEIDSSNWSKMVERAIPPLTPLGHKGSSGRVAIVGGSARYTGAPYYASMAALKVGSDLATVFCASEASIPIKCYSPELMVSPVYEASKFDLLVKNGESRSEEAR